MRPSLRGDQLRDLDVEADQLRGIARVGLDERRAAFGVAAPTEDLLRAEPAKRQRARAARAGEARSASCESDHSSAATPICGTRIAMWIHGARDRVASLHRKEVSLETRGKKDDTLGEEVSALGQRTKGAAKDMVGDLIDDEEMEAEGKLENAAGRARQATNNVMDETDGVRGATVHSDRYVTGLYNTPESANRAYEGLTSKHGYKSDDISVLMSDDTRTKYFGDVKPGTELSGGTKAAEGLGKGAAIGGGIGAALAALFAIGTSIVIPGLGLVVAGPDRSGARGRRRGWRDRRPDRRADWRRHSRRSREGIRARHQGRRHSDWNALSRRRSCQGARAGLHVLRRQQRPLLAHWREARVVPGLLAPR